MKTYTKATIKHTSIAGTETIQIMYYTGDQVVDFFRRLNNNHQVVETVVMFYVPAKTKSYKNYI